MSFIFKVWAYVGWLLIVGFIVLAIWAITGGFEHPWSDPPV